MDHRCPAKKVVIDGGWLLHQITWPSDDTFETIGKSYVTLVKSNAKGRSTSVMFDGYAHSPKDHEHKRRSKTAVGGIEVQVLPSKVCPVTKAKFMSNGVNKTNFISYLRELLQDSGIEVCKARDDGDTLIVKIALAENDSDNAVEILAEDTDILVLLLHHSPSALNSLYFTTNKGTYDVKKLYTKLSDNEKSRLLFLHAFTGCDTVSGIYRHTKVTLMRTLCVMDEDLELDYVFEELMSLDNLQENIVEAGIFLFQSIYGDISKSLKDHRLSKYTKMTVTNTLKLEYLAPSEGAVRQHTLRAYLQYHDWVLLSSMTLPPTEYGWRMAGDGSYAPIGMLEPVAPEQLLKLTVCNCTSKSNCSGRCSCRKMGMSCIQACGNCNGVDCTNTAPTEEAENDD